MKALVAALERIATALEQLVPALTQASRVYHMTQNSVTGYIGHEDDSIPPDPRMYEL